MNPTTEKINRLSTRITEKETPQTFKVSFSCCNKSCSLKCTLTSEFPLGSSPTTPVLCGWGQKADYKRND